MGYGPSKNEGVGTNEFRSESRFRRWSKLGCEQPQIFDSALQALLFGGVEKRRRRNENQPEDE